MIALFIFGLGLLLAGRQALLLFED